MSLVNQIPETGGAFSYCLPSYDILSPRWLRFGRGLGGAFPVGAALAPLVYNPRTQNFYYVGLSGGPIPTLASHGFLIPVDGVETVCFAFAPLASGLSIIGNVQQTGIQISIDEACGYVGFGPNVC
ncbi:hypothetical protein LWI29_024120 [Acer saccharum]|uniref:Uncharacterized protein n=1 Tax=Acer saccharum TaxID=4024 RepID=A0AA39UVQ7_ACESA|nr:hypothetical protein LWI29_024120 [Acer saccharum]KAK1553021.1 hypothetical protein Q3G72_027321 [Acer saccharum]